MKTNKLTRPMFLFDADCGVCEKGTDAIRGKVSPPVDIVAYQSVDYESFGVTLADLNEGPVFIGEQGNFLVGPLAMGAMLSLSRRPYKYFGKTMLAPGVRQILKKIGPTMYKNRKYLPGATPACAIDKNKTA